MLNAQFSRKLLIITTSIHCLSAILLSQMLPVYGASLVWSLQPLDYAAWNWSASQM